jgi:hypothetical protein
MIAGGSSSGGSEARPSRQQLWRHEEMSVETTAKEARGRSYAVVEGAHQSRTESGGDQGFMPRADR